MQKIVVNRCHGGFGLSFAAVKEIARRKKENVYFYVCIDGSAGYGKRRYKRIDRKPKDGVLIFDTSKDLGPEITEAQLNKAPSRHFFLDRLERDDADLVAVVEKLGKKANGQYSDLEVREIPDGVSWSIKDHAGSEWIAEEHRTW